MKTKEFEMKKRTKTKNRKAEQKTIDSGNKDKGKTAKKSESNTCFVMMPFADPIGGYYQSIYEPAIEKAGLIPIRADNTIFSTGEIMEQVWTRISGANILIAELTTQNPNVYYELGLAHALEKPVILICSEEEKDNVPFDLRNLRVIYYDLSDPFWGANLIKRIVESIEDVLSNPSGAIFKAINK
jgi:hypothetical protein